MNNSKQLSIYLASGWFTPKTREILDKLESLLSDRSDVKLYSPRRDGIMLPPNQKHDTALRENIFAENISHITDADLVVANIHSEDPYNDPGTIYEIGYAMAHNVPVLGFAESFENIPERFLGFIEGFDCIVKSYSELNLYLDNYISVVKNAPQKILFVGSGNSDTDTKVASSISDSGFSLRWVNETSEVYPRIDEIFDNVQCLIAVIDDRKTLVSWMIGQAYSRGIPVITYSDQNYGINVMLLISILTHIRGTEELNKFLQQLKRSGISSIPKFDISQMDSM